MRNPCLGLVLLCSLNVQGAAEVEKISIAVGEMTFDAMAAGPSDGVPVVLLHGFPQTSHSFHRLLPALTAAGFRAVAPDQRGYSPGARPEGVAAYAMPNLVGDVIGIADSLGFETFHLVGHDWGGAVAWVVAGIFPQRVRSLVAISTPHPAAFGQAMADPESDQSSRSSYMQMFASDGSESSFLANDALMLRTILASPPIPEEDRNVYLEALGSEESLRAALNWYRALLAGRQSTASSSSAGAPQTPGAPSVQVATTYVWGTEDMAFSNQAARASEKHVSGPYHFHPLEGVGHWVLEEHAEGLERIVLEHLEKYRDE